MQYSKQNQFCENVHKRNGTASFFVQEQTFSTSFNNKKRKGDIKLACCRDSILEENVQRSIEPDISIISGTSVDSN